MITIRDIAKATGLSTAFLIGLRTDERVSGSIRVDSHLACRLSRRHIFVEPLNSPFEHVALVVWIGKPMAHVWIHY